MNRILVTGGTGFIGRNVIPLLATRGFEVHVMGRGLSAAAGAIFHVADLLDPIQSARVVEGVRPTHLLHLAWSVEPGKYETSPANVRWVEASLQLLRSFVEAGGRRCVTAGSVSEYEGGGDLCRENEPCRPPTLYGVCKHALGNIQTELCRAAGISSAVGRIFHCYGPHEQERRVVPSVAISLLKGEPALSSEGLQVRTFMHVEDVARAFVTVIESELEGPVNIGSAEAVPLRQVLDLLGSITGRPDLLRPGAYQMRPTEPMRLVPDVTRLHSAGFVPRFSLEEGLADTVAWWRHNLNPGAHA